MSAPPAQGGVARARGPIPPVYLALAMLLMWVLASWAPILSWRGAASRAVGAVLAVIAVTSALWSSVLFRAAGTTIHAFEESSALVTRGPYRVSRNPMYSSMALLLLGLAFWLRALSPFFVIPLFVVLIQKRFILAEEARLESAFGAAYMEYKGRVRRWI